MLELLNTRDIAQMYRVTSATVLNWIRAGKLKAYATPGGHYRVAREDLDAFVRLYGLPPAAGIPSLGLRLLLVGSDRHVFDRLCRTVQSRWPAAELEHARSEFEIGWWLALLRPTHILAHPADAPPALLEHCRRLAAEADGDRPRLSLLPKSPDEDLDEWLEQEFNIG